jgi:hypothetical protein
MWSKVWVEDGSKRLMEVGGRGPWNVRCGSCAVLRRLQCWNFKVGSDSEVAEIVLGGEGDGRVRRLGYAVEGLRIGRGMEWNVQRQRQRQKWKRSCN